MENEKSHMSKRILNLTLEIIYLLTGEDLMVVKKSGELVACRISTNLLAASVKAQDPIPPSPCETQSSEKNHEEKILDLSNKVIHLLTGEVIVSLQIWKFIDHEVSQTRSEGCMEEPQDEFNGMGTPERLSSREDYAEVDAGSPESITEADTLTNVKLVIMPQTDQRDAYVKIKEEDQPLTISSVKKTENRWNSCSDQYCRELTEMGRSGDGAPRKRPYMYTKQLRFLKPVMDLRPTVDSHEEPDIDESQQSNGEGARDTSCVFPRTQSYTSTHRRT
ncbi:uncharacterized protein LOC122939804 isoform X4 [Bufo gargarizans]|uniref:uncharacterized protein LOC122939804 isoform X4 n=1 Tax=Bufo gargarizans TaxID=30331 RepID=UPI001CF18287|nr:uncharacterized protein LOC122939804 isoform X4 [Bufo gargarizans]